MFSRVLIAVAERSNTPMEQWEFISGPESGVGTEFWLRNAQAGLEAYVCQDQDDLTVAITAIPQ
jgi:hypothetical protein